MLHEPWGSKRAPWQVSQGVTTSGRNDISATMAPWPSHAGQRPPAGVLKEKRAGVQPRALASGSAAKSLRSYEPAACQFRR
jgi:hypothetical protein